MIPDDASLRRFFANALPAVDVVRAAMGGTAVLRGLWRGDIPKPEVVLRWMQLSTKAGAEHLDAKAWLDDGQLSPLAYQRFATSSTSEDDLERWESRCVGRRSFAVVMTKLEEVDEALAYAVAAYVAPVVRTYAPLVPINVGCFLGRYPATPFGIHKDEHITAAVHFPLGPGGKRLYFWQKNRDLPHDVGALTWSQAIATAESFDVAVGDGMVISGADTHVGTATETSANLVLMFKAARVSTVVEQVRRELTCLREDLVQWGAPHPAAGASLPEWWRSLTGEQIQQIACELRRLALASNGGLGAPPIPRSGGLPREASFRVAAPEVFPLLFREAHGRIVVAARGRLRACSLHPDVFAWLERLANGVLVAFTDTQSATSDERLRSEMLMCLGWLYQTRVLERVDPEKASGGPS